MSTVLKVENISKQYRLGQVGTGTLTHDMRRMWYKLRQKEDPYLRVGDSNKRNEIGDSEYVWALRDINFTVEQGDVVGIIGKNGAGKSTLLKLLSRITAPTLGSISVKGRIAALLEVGTGFHPDLTGRENIYLNGAILGMRKSEISLKFDEIVEFSGCQKYIDTPVKRYSSGMIVRLGFAVAAHLDPEILIVDEVLAVGDAEFQEKCIGKMQDISGEGRTVLFVSHNMASMKSLCKKGLLLSQGELIYQDNITNTVDKYLNTSLKSSDFGAIPSKASTYNTGQVKFTRINLFDKNNNPTDLANYMGKLDFRLELDSNDTIPDVLLDIRITSKDGIELIHASNKYGDQAKSTINAGINTIRAVITNQLQPGDYSVSIGIHQLNGKALDFVENIFDFSVLAIAEDNSVGFIYDYQLGYVRFESDWTIS